MVAGLGEKTDEMCRHLMTHLDKVRCSTAVCTYNTTVSLFLLLFCCFGLDWIC